MKRFFKVLLACILCFGTSIGLALLFPPELHVEVFVLSLLLGIVLGIYIAVQYI